LRHGWRHGTEKNVPCLLRIQVAQPKSCHDWLWQSRFVDTKIGASDKKPNHLRRALRRCLTEITIRRRAAACFFFQNNPCLLLTIPAQPTSLLSSDSRLPNLPSNLPPSFPPVGRPWPASRHGPLPAPSQHVPVRVQAIPGSKSIKNRLPLPSDVSACPSLIRWRDNEPIAHRLSCASNIHSRHRANRCRPPYRPVASALLCVTFWKPSVSCLHPSELCSDRRPHPCMFDNDDQDRRLTHPDYVFAS
jgi:hypothetical protein